MTDPYAPVLPALEQALGRPLDARDRACLARGLRSFLATGGPADRAAEILVESLDRDLAGQIDEILHHPTFQALESAWRGAWLVVSRSDPAQGVRCELLNCSKEDLLLDFEDSPTIRNSGLFKIVYSAEYGPFGGRPFAAILADYEIGPGDLALLRLCCEACALASLPFLASASPALVEAEPDPAWTAFLRSPDARSAALVFPRCLGRAEHPGETVRRHADRLWQSGVFALGAVIVRSFELFRLASDLTGPEGGAVEDLPGWSGARGDWAAPSPVEIPLPDHARAHLAARGFVPLGAGPAGALVFDRAPTLLAPGAGPADLAPEDLALHRDLSALFVVTRLVQTLKVLHREQIGTWKELDTLREALTAQLAVWTQRSGDPPAGRPLRAFELRVEAGEPRSGTYPFTLRVTPNWSHAGRFFTLAVDGVLDLE